MLSGWFRDFLLPLDDCLESFPDREHVYPPHSLQPIPCELGVKSLPLLPRTMLPQGHFNKLLDLYVGGIPGGRILEFKGKHVSNLGSCFPQLPSKKVEPISAPRVIGFEYEKGRRPPFVL